VPFRLGVDFGTSTTVACLRWPDGRTRPLLFDGSPLLPSAVYLDEGRLLVGRDAVHSARISPAHFEPNPKQRIDEGVVLLGSEELPVADLVAAVLRRVAAEAATVTGGAGYSVTIACPAAWGEHRRHTLLDAAHAAGLPRARLVAEPIAAASYFDAVVRGPGRPPGNLVVYDLGAGTFDVSVVAHGSGGFEVRVTDGLADIGGLDIDAAIVGFLGALSPDDLTWARLEQPTTTPDMRARRQLWDDVRTAKEMLSRSSSTLIFVPLVEKDIPLGRAQFERLVRPLLQRTVVTTKAALRRAALPAAEPLDIFLVGGASRVPLIATLLHRELGQPPTAIEQPELAVAEGCLIAGDPGAGDHTPPPYAQPFGPVPGVQRPVAPFGSPVGPVSPGTPGFGHVPPAPVPPAPGPPVPAAPAPGTAVPGPPVPVAPVPVSPVPAYVQPHPQFPPPGYRPGWPGAPPWTALVQVLDLAVGESEGYTLRCYVPATRPGEDPDAVFLTADGRLLVFDQLEDLVRYVRSSDGHEMARFVDWRMISSLDPVSAERCTVEAYELDLILANVAHGTKEWSPELFVKARDLAVELGSALALRPVLRAFNGGSLLDEVDDAMRLHVGRRASSWWRDRRLNPDEVTTVRDTWHRVVTAVEAAIWPR
jgi:hypothetical protein